MVTLVKRKSAPPGRQPPAFYSPLSESTQLVHVRKELVCAASPAATSDDDYRCVGVLSSIDGYIHGLCEIIFIDALALYDFATRGSVEFKHLRRGAVQVAGDMRRSSLLT